MAEEDWDPEVVEKVGSLGLGDAGVKVGDLYYLSYYGAGM